MVDHPVDIADCAREPIHVPGAVQPHGALVVFDPAASRILQASNNAASILGVPVAPGQHLEAVTGEWPHLEDILKEARANQAQKAVQRTLVSRRGTLDVVVHSTPQGLICELELGTRDVAAVVDGPHGSIGQYLEETSLIRDVSRLGDVTARWVRKLTGYNRTLVYRFDENWNGTVIAEDRDEILPSYLDLRFPESDIPAQARELYLRNRTRLIPDAGYVPVPVEPLLNPLDGRQLDMSPVMLRSVSPVHLEYMRNMDTAASMSVSIIVDGRLWGLISCHNRQPKPVPPPTRMMCDLLGQVLAQQIGALERMELASRRVALKEIEARLLANVSFAPSLGEGLRLNAQDWMGLTNADGAALIRSGTVYAVGQTPSIDDIMALAEWLRRRGNIDVYASAYLQEEWPEAARLVDTGSGIVAASISQIHSSFILWFRREVVTTVKWGGDPRKPARAGSDRLHPRNSFEIWKELVRGRSLPWSKAELAAAGDFRTSIVNLVLKRAEERAELTEELERSNSELEAFSYSISHDLRAPFRHVVGYSKLLAERESGLDETSQHYLQSIVDAALSAGRLVDDLLHFSQLGRASLSAKDVDLGKLVEEVRRTLELQLAGRRVEWRIDRLPPVFGDPNLLRQVLSNLIDNALKYSRGRDLSIISVSAEDLADEVVVKVTDNGVGFDMAYVGKLFGVFQRLHRAEEFEGTGIGLALSKRIVERHGGWIEAQGKLGVGACMTFSLPKRGRKARHAERINHG